MKFNKGPLLNQSGFSVYGGGAGQFGVSWSAIVNPGSNLYDTLSLVTYCPDTHSIDALQLVAIEPLLLSHLFSQVIKLVI